MMEMDKVLDINIFIHRKHFIHQGFTFFNECTDYR